MSKEKIVRIESGYDISVAVTGNLDHPTIMLLNGSIFNYRQFNQVYLPKLKKIVDSQYSFIQYDYVGYGKSSELDGDFDFVTIADQHLELMNALGVEKAHLFGVSKGSIISQLVTAKYPQRVISLAGYGNPNLADDTGRTISANEFGARLDSVQSLSGIYDDHITSQNYDLIYDTVYVPAIFDKQLSELGFFEKIRNMWIKSKLKPMLLGPKIEMLDKLFSYYKREITEEEKLRYKEAVKSIQVPTLLIHGTADETVPPSSSKLLAKWIPNAQLELINGYRHSNPMLLPWQGGKVMKIYSRFLKQHYSG